MIINSRNYAVAFLYTCRKKPALLSTSRPEQMGETRGVISLCTDLGSLIGDIQCGNFRILLPILILREIYFGLFQRVKIRHFSHLCSTEFLIFELLTFSSVKFS